MSTSLNVLIVEDLPADADLLLFQLRRAGFAPQAKRVETEADFLAELQNLPDIIISDYSMPRFSGLKAMELLRQSGLNIPFILVSGTVGEDVAVAAMRQGATDYLLKDRLARLGAAVERALEQQRLRAERQQAEISLNLFRTLIDQSNDGIEVIDPETSRILDVNETTCRRLGYQRAELLAMFVPDIEAAAVDFATWPGMKAAIQETGFKIIEGRQKRKDGSTFPVEISVRHVKLDREYLIAAVRDISERRKADQELRESQALYQSLVGQMPAGVFRKDRAGRYVFANPWFCQLRSMAVEQIVGRTAGELTALEEKQHGRTRPEILQLLDEGLHHHEEILRTGRPIQVEEAYPEAGGGKRYLQVVKSAVFGLDGQITGTQGVQFDITELKRAEVSLNLFRALVDRSTDGIDVIEPETGRFLDVNETTCQRTGFTRQELLAMTVPELAGVALDAETWRRRAEAIRLAGFQTFEGRQKRKDGSTFPVEISIRHVRLDREYLISSVRDITERRQAEEVLRASEGRYRTLFQYAPDGILIATPEGRYVDANESICRMLGYAREDLIGRQAADIVVPEEIPHIRPALDLINSKSNYQREWQFRRKDGSVFTAEVIATLMPEGNLLAMFRDMTERKQAEAEIHNQLDELQRWHAAMMGREDRVLELKGEVNELLAGRHQPIRYPETTQP